MSPATKYTLGRLGLFVVFFAALLPVTGLHVLLRAVIALVLSAAAALFLLRGWRDETAEQLASIGRRRRSEQERLRAALAGDGSAGAAGDRVDGRGVSDAPSGSPDEA